MCPQKDHALQNENSTPAASGHSCLFCGPAGNVFEVLKKKASLKLRYEGDEQHLRQELGMLKSCFGS